MSRLVGTIIVRKSAVMLNLVLEVAKLLDNLLALSLGLRVRGSRGRTVDVVNGLSLEAGEYRGDQLG